MITDKELQYRFKGLHNKIMQEIIDFCNSNGIKNVDEIILSSTDVNNSIIKEMWSKETKSTLIIADKDKNIILQSN